MSDQHAQGYYAAPGRETNYQTHSVESWSLDSQMVGPTSGVFDGPSSGVGTNAVNMVGLSRADPNSLVNSGAGPIPPGYGVIPTI
jgi:hypothetical protein